MNVLVVGDVIIDRYTHGKKRGISAETPTVVGEFEREDSFIGGAGLVVRNLLRLGCDVTLLTTGPCLGDELGLMFMDQADKPSNEEMLRLTSRVVTLPGWKFTEKRRYYVDDYKMVQYDILNRGGYVQHQSGAFLQTFRTLMDKGDFHSVVVCDNRHGVPTQEIAAGILDIAKTYHTFTYVDSQVSQNQSNHGWYEGADWILLNMAEAIGLLPFAGGNQIGVEFSKISKLLSSGIIVKMGPGGAVMYNKDTGDYAHSSGFRVEAVDTCGAGDAFLAAFVTHGNLEEANRWAALSTTYKGTIVPKMEDLRKVI